MAKELYVNSKEKVMVAPICDVDYLHFNVTEVQTVRTLLFW